MKITLLLILIAVLLIFTSTNAFEFSDIYYGKAGFSYGTASSTINDFWERAYNLGAGTNLITRRYTQLWLAADLNYFPAQKNTVFPIDPVYQDEDIPVKVDDMYIVTLMTKFYAFWTDRNWLIAPYNGIGLGFSKRTATHYHSESPYFQSADANFPWAICISFSIGLNVRLSQNLNFLCDMEFTNGFSKPTWSGYGTLACWVAFRP